MSISVVGGNIFDRTNINKQVINGIEFEPVDVEMMKKVAAAKICKLSVEEQLQILGAVKEPQQPVAISYYQLEHGKRTIEVGTVEEVKHFTGEGWVLIGTVVKRL